MYDNNNILQAATTVTATAQSAAFDLKTGTPRRGMKARFMITAESSTTAGTVFNCAIEKSSDNITWAPFVQSEPITTTTAAAGKEIFVNFETSFRYIRTAINMLTSTGVIAVVYSADLGLARP